LQYIQADSIRFGYHLKGCKVIANQHQTRFIRVNQLAKTPKSDGVLPMSRATIWRKVKNGTFPAPIKLSDNVTAWAMSDIEDYLKAQVNK